MVTTLWVRNSGAFIFHLSSDCPPPRYHAPSTRTTPFKRRNSLFQSKMDRVVLLSVATCAAVAVLAADQLGVAHAEEHAHDRHGHEHGHAEHTDHFKTVYVYTVQFMTHRSTLALVLKHIFMHIKMVFFKSAKTRVYPAIATAAIQYDMITAAHGGCYCCCYRPLHAARSRRWADAFLVDYAHANTIAVGAVVSSHPSRLQGWRRHLPNSFP